MKNISLTRRRVKVSPKNALSVRLSSVESKLDRVLSLLGDRQQSFQVDPSVMQDAIRAHLLGDRKPIEALERIWELQEGRLNCSHSESVSKPPYSNTVGTSTGVDKKTIPNGVVND